MESASILPFTFNIYTILFSTFILVPPFTFLTIFIGTIFLQKIRTPIGIEYIKFDRPSYRIRLVGVYLFIILLFGFREVFPLQVSESYPNDWSASTFGIGILFAMGMVANFSAKRLRGMGYSHYWALLCAVPIVGLLMESWLIFSKREDTTPADPNIFN